jgi:hypothetical protein
VVTKRERHLPYDHLSGSSHFFYDHRLPRGQFDDRHLSGDLVFCVPWDRHETGANYHRMKTASKTRPEKFEDGRIGVYPASLWDNRTQNLYPHGFAIHAPCWDLIQRTIGPSAESELDLLVRTLLQRWQEQPFEVSSCMDGRAWAQGENILVELEGLRGVCDPPDTLEGQIAVTNPMDIPEVKDIIRKATEKSADKEERRKPESDTSSNSFGESSMRFSTSKTLLTLPFDIQLLLLDFLRPADARKTLTATGWHVPDSYWRRRSPRKLIFEIDDLDPAVKVDWTFFCQEADELIESKSLYGLQNRQRLFRILTGTRDMFFSTLADRDRKEQEGGN